MLSYIELRSEAMQPRTCRIDLVASSIAALLVLTACQHDLTDPAANKSRLSEAPWSATSVVSVMNGRVSHRRSFRSAEHSYVLDAETGTLQETGGRSVRLSPQHVALVSRAIDRFAAAQKSVERLTSSRGYRETDARWG